MHRRAGNAGATWNGAMMLTKASTPLVEFYSMNPAASNFKANRPRLRVPGRQRTAAIEKDKRTKLPGGQHEHTVLLLQGGGALGAYQAGVYEAMHELGFAPDWVTGVSIGAINAALIAGNAPARGVERLREFWERVSSGMPIVPPVQIDPVHVALNRLSAATAVAFGVPGFFVPRIPPAFLAPDGTSAALSVYDTSPLRATLEELVDFDRINSSERLRLSVGAVNVHSGNSNLFRQPVSAPRCEARHGKRFVAARLPADRDRRRSLLGRRHRFEFPAVVHHRRFAAHQRAHRAGGSLRRAR
jgi:hypothetical protein